MLAGQLLRQIEGLIHPDGTGSQYSYTPDGLMTIKTDPNGGTFTYTYDGYGRAVEAQNPYIRIGYGKRPRTQGKIPTLRIGTGKQWWSHWRL